MVISSLLVPSGQRPRTFGGLVLWQCSVTDRRRQMAMARRGCDQPLFVVRQELLFAIFPTSQGSGIPTGF